MRRYWISHSLASIYKTQRWKNLSALGMVESERHENGQTTKDRRYYILSFYNVELFAKAVCSHWGSENK